MGIRREGKGREAHHALVRAFRVLFVLWDRWFFRPSGGQLFQGRAAMFFPRPCNFLPPMPLPTMLRAESDATWKSFRCGDAFRRFQAVGNGCCGASGLLLWRRCGRQIKSGIGKTDDILYNWRAGRAFLLSVHWPVGKKDVNSRWIKQKHFSDKQTQARFGRVAYYNKV